MFGGSSSTSLGQNLLPLVKLEYSMSKLIMIFRIKQYCHKLGWPIHRLQGRTYFHSSFVRFVNPNLLIVMCIMLSPLQLIKGVRWIPQKLGFERPHPSSPWSLLSWMPEDFMRSDWAKDDAHRRLPEPWGYPQSSSISNDGIFHKKPSMLGTPMTMEPHMM